MQHIGFIMDGNRRWAKKQGKLSQWGHEHGGDNIEKILDLCHEAKIPIVSMWALSKENLTKRSSPELEGIFSILRKKLPDFRKKLLEEHMRFETVGDIDLLPQDITATLREITEATRGGVEMTFVLALVYSGQDEIIRAIKQFFASGKSLDSLDERSFLDSLETGQFPPPDLIVRTGGDPRHSGFFLYQSAYSEYFFTDTLWPDFGREEFDRAMDFFAGVKRNFGK